MTQQLINWPQYIMTYNNRSMRNSHIIVDISNTFGRMWHKKAIIIYLFLLEAVSIRGSLAVWFQNYSQNHKQAVVIKGKKSEYNTVPSGTPQGSVLGPLLFFIYIYIQDINKHSQFHKPF